MKVKVLRVELGLSFKDDDGWFTNIGPYTSRSIFGKTPDFNGYDFSTSLKSASASWGNPLPYSDGMTDWDSTYLFGFRNKDQLLAWFREEISKLSSNGFVISLYEVDETFVDYGKKQLAFKKEHATLINMFSPVDYALGAV